MKKFLKAIATFFTGNGWNPKTITLAILFAVVTITASVWLGFFRDGLISHILAIVVLIPLVYTVIKYLKE